VYYDTAGFTIARLALFSNFINIPCIEL